MTRQHPHEEPQKARKAGSHLFLHVHGDMCPVVPSLADAEYQELGRTCSNRGFSSLLTESVPFSRPSGVSQLKIQLQEYKMHRNFLRQLSLKEWQGEHSKRNTSTRDVKAAPSNREGDALPPITAEQGECQGRAAHPHWDSPML